MGFGKQESLLRMGRKSPGGGELPDLSPFIRGLLSAGQSGSGLGKDCLEGKQEGDQSPV